MQTSSSVRTATRSPVYNFAELQLSGAGVYTLTGTGEEPLSEGHVALVCPTRVRSQRRVKVPNVLGDQEVTYR